ncbi:hypothetical protein NECAME_02604 [Necator americanus]|uniref:Uncharacterized protein n=1 Tax=Necator americanus TaxID=51031 RepID=W2TE61_NECAM|nr:hypothetical protein NECAME_02604 [Necator americanus]ETN79486.1 hypothetical protein NECAME_02604 [Necator americanus]
MSYYHPDSSLRSSRNGTSKDDITIPLSVRESPIPPPPHHLIDLTRDRAREETLMKYQLHTSVLSSTALDVFSGREARISQNTRQK